jgi:DHA1 family tetracycline resistance protein-like MFS transporter
LALHFTRHWHGAVYGYNAPEGFADPALTALMSDDAPADAQGELQGGIASAKNLAMLLGTPMFAQIFGYYLEERSAEVAAYSSFLTTAALCFAAIAVFTWQIKRRSPPKASLPP